MLTTGRPLDSSIAALRSRLDGTLVRPGDDGWNAARRAWNLAVDQRPTMVALPLAPRTSGRWSTSPGATACGSRCRARATTRRRWGRSTEPSSSGPPRCAAYRSTRSSASPGAVTAIEFELVPLAEVYAGMMLWPLERASEVLHAWREWTASAPDSVTTSARILHFRPCPS